MRYMMIGTVLLLYGIAVAQDFSKMTDAERKQVNDWMAERAEQMIEAHKLESELTQAWMSTAYSAPEIVALRTRYQEQMQALAATQQALEKKVSEIPAVREKRSRLDAMKIRVRTLTKKVEEKTGGSR